MPTWTQIFQDTFTRANGAVANGWTDVNNKWAIVNNTLQSTSSTYWQDLLEGPSSTSLADFQILYTVTAISGGTPLVWGGTNTTSKSGYVVWADVTALHIGILVNGAQPPQSINSSSCTLTSGQQYLITFTRVGTSMTATIALASTPATILATVNLTDSTYGTGVVAISPLTSPNTVQSIAVYTDNGVSVGALAIASNTSSAGMTFTATAAGGTTPYTAKLYRFPTAPFTPPGFGTLVATSTGSATSLSLTDATPPPGDNYYRILLTDTNGNTTLSSQSTSQGAIFARQNAAPIFIGAIGDSLTLGSFGSGTTPLQYMVSVLADALPQQPVTANNQAISGTASGDWIVGGTNYSTAKSAFATAIAAMNPPPAKKFVLVQLGTNDAKDANVTPQATFSANLSGFVNDLVNAGYIVLFNAPPWIPPTSSGWSEQANSFLEQYRAAMTALANNITIGMGVATMLEYFSQNPSLYSTQPHLTDAGYSDMGAQFWAPGFMNFLLNVTPSAAQIAAAVAAAILKSPTNLLATDTNGNVTTSSLTTSALASITGSGTGTIPINQNTGGTDNLRYVDSSGNGIANAQILIYNATDWPSNPTNVQATSETAPDGRWLTPCYVTHGTYVAVFNKLGADGPNVSPPFTV